jgi:predicted AAA+ superfamily ATPase
MPTFHVDRAAEVARSTGLNGRDAGNPRLRANLEAFGFRDRSDHCAWELEMTLDQWSVHHRDWSGSLINAANNKRRQRTVQLIEQEYGVMDRLGEEGTGPDDFDMYFVHLVDDIHGKVLPVAIQRTALLASIRAALERAPVVVLTGPRQSGKTTLAREFLAADSPNYFDLEDPASLARLDEPRIALEGLRGLVVLDEIQRRPELFPVLRVLADRAGAPARFLILGSASGELLRQSSESLAGRMERIEIGGFRLEELGVAAAGRLWLRGGLPRSYLARTDGDSLIWRKQFVLTLLERDFPQWGVRVPAAALARFWTMLAHYHGQTWNAAEPAQALGVSRQTCNRHLDLLTDALMMRQLRPWHANLAKRQVKSPKIYVRDSGLLHGLLGIESERALFHHPKVGASWEGFAIEQVLAAEAHDDAWFWATQQGAEMDLILRRGDRLFGVECKRADAPRITPSIRIAMADLGLERVAIVHPGERRYAVGDRVEAVPLGALVEGGALFPGRE